MAIVGNSTNRVRSGQLGNKGVASIAGVPGTGLSDAYARVDLDVKLAATDTGALYIALSNGSVTQQHMSNASDYNNPWNLFAIARTSPFSITIPAGTHDLWPIVQGDAFGSWQWWGGSYSLDFTGNTTFGAVAELASESQASSLGYALLPFNISQLDKSTSSKPDGTQTTTSVMHLCMPILYQHTNQGVTDPITLGSTPVTLDISQLVDYYPFAIRKSGVMQSANRSGGSTLIRKSGSWRAVRNADVPGYDNKAFVRQGGTWVRAPRIGANQ